MKFAALFIIILAAGCHTTHTLLLSSRNLEAKLNALKVSCPATLDENFSGPPTQSGRTNWLREMHPGAASEIRHSSGLQCTYNDAGLLITDGIAAGTFDLISPDVDKFGHFQADVSDFIDQMIIAQGNPLHEAIVDYQVQHPTPGMLIDAGHHTPAKRLRIDKTPHDSRSGFEFSLGTAMEIPQIPAFSTEFVWRLPVAPIGLVARVDSRGLVLVMGRLYPFHSFSPTRLPLRPEFFMDIGAGAELGEFAKVIAFGAGAQIFLLPGYGFSGRVGGRIGPGGTALLCELFLTDAFGN